MTVFRLAFAGQIKKVEHRTAGDKPLAEVSVCRKNRGRQGEPEAFTWVRVTIWEPADFQVAKLVKGAFVAGTGDMSARSFDGKDGAKMHSIEVRCSSFDVEVSDGAAEEGTAPAPRRAPAAKPAPATTDDEPPF